MMISQQNGSSETEAALAVDLMLELERGPGAPAVARAAVIGRCDDLDLDLSMCHTLVLLVSEVVSNAVLHSRGPADTPILLTVRVTEESVRITVTDAGYGFKPEPRRPEATHGGYGLYLLEKSTSRWGVDRVGGTRVWFELARTL
jgi:anti-sigma regulatory factor (Ser/Thr protein kinase)